MYHFIDREQQSVNPLPANLSLDQLQFKHHYFIDTTEPLDAKEQQQVMSILGNVMCADIGTSEPLLMVVPRLGTISAWSSKATDIAKVCGLHKVTRIERGIQYQWLGMTQETCLHLQSHFYDRMTQTVVNNYQSIVECFQLPEHTKKEHVPINELATINDKYGLALSEQDIDYLRQKYTELDRDPTLTELMMFGQVNSEHCRHKIFNATWTIDGEPQSKSLFAMIKNTYQNSAKGILSAYHDNGAVIEGHAVQLFMTNPSNQSYQFFEDNVHSVIKVETHNHPTAIAPFFGAATGAGGEIRDEGATGIGARPKGGLCGFSVSNLQIPNFIQPWEVNNGKPSHIASALDIMLQGPIGAASFNNEFGRPNLCGYFRSFEQKFNGQIRGYHKPIMIAGGLGNIREQHIQKGRITPKMKLIVLGGPAMQIGLGGGAASSMHAGVSDEALDFASVQRSNPEMQRRCQQVINHCVTLGQDNPIVSIHDVGAGGLSNAMPELVHDSGCGGLFQLRDIPNAEPGMAPMAIWCNEAQERYVLAINSDSEVLFRDIAARERCPYAIIGTATGEQHLQLHDTHDQSNVVDVPMSVLFHDAPKLHRDAQNTPKKLEPIDTSAIDFSEALARVLHHPCVASKQFLITIGDRSVTGLVARDQMVGPWQIPVADAAVTALSFTANVGEAMAMGERSPVALIDAQAASRLAVSEAITNILSAPINELSDIKLSANWMAATGDAQEEADLYAAVKAVGVELCPELDITIPVGKDSLSMRMQWAEAGQQKSVTSPVSLIISAFAPVDDVRNTITPQLRSEHESQLWLIDLGANKNRLGGSVLGEVYNQLGARVPDLDNPGLLQELHHLLKSLRAINSLWAYHDRSDGGVIVTLLEMAFASHLGLDITIDDSDWLRAAFCEELGVVVQVPSSAANILQNSSLRCLKIAVINDNDQINLFHGGQKIFSESRAYCQRLWSETSYHMQRLRDDASCADQEFALISDPSDRGLYSAPSFDLSRAALIKKTKPRIAILREQGVNGHVEMAAAFTLSGFECIDVHMTDIIEGRVTLDQFQGMAACGGFSYGDVLGAGRGWGNAILFNARAREQFQNFFNRPDTFTLGVCNGCQMLSTIRELIPGTGHWSTFERNVSRQFEARLLMVSIEPSPSIFFAGMAGSQLPIVVAHGEGRLNHNNAQQLIDDNVVTMRYIGEQYPHNPNGSVQGITGLCSLDGRVTIMMPHPERVFKTSQFSWHPTDWDEYSPWMRMFDNARRWVD